MMEEKVDDEQSTAAADARNGVSLNRSERLSILLSAVALVILPLLPDEGIGPVHLFNPFVAWRLLMIVMLASTAGYVAQRLFGASIGCRWSGSLAALCRARQQPGHAELSF
jgi:uncharacterized membrane protein (DUF4010 family)